MVFKLIQIYFFIIRYIINSNYHKIQNFKYKQENIFMQNLIFFVRIILILDMFVYFLLHYHNFFIFIFL